MKIAIVGAGISGCSLAYELTKRKSSKDKISLFERESEIATQASGNFLGVIMPVAHAEKTKISEFSKQAFLHTKDILEAFGWEASGVIHLAHSEERKERFRKTIANQSLGQEIVQAVSAKQASELAGVELSCEGLYFPEAGYVSPRDFCQRLLEESDCESIHLDKEVVSLNDLGDYDHIVFCNAYEAKNFEETKELPLRSLRGQCLCIKSEELSTLKSVLCFDGYLTPSDRNDWHALGASFNREIKSLDIRKEETKELVEKLKKHLGVTQVEVTEERASFRTTTPDHLPILGRLNNSKVWTNLGMGSRGLSYAPFCSQQLSKELFQN